MIGEFYRAESVEQALSFKQQHPRAAWLAGGTELVSVHRNQVEAVIDISRLPLKEIRETADGGVCLGALVTLDSLAAHTFKDSRLAAIASAAACVRNRNVRNMATVGGNLATRKASSDLTPVLLVLTAEAEIVQVDGTKKKILLKDWLAAGDDSLLLSVEIAAPADHERVLIRSFTRVACDLALVNGAVRVQSAGGKIISLQAALGCLAAHTELFDLTCSVIEGDDEIALAASLRKELATKITARDDHRAGAEYRLDLAAVLVSEMAVAALREGREA